MKKIAIFSDIHGNIQALTSIMNDIRSDTFDDIYFLGDMIGFGPNPKECVDLLRNANIKIVKGNHEVYQTNDEIARKLLTEEELTHRDWIRKQLDDSEFEFINKLPMSIETIIEGKLYTFEHFFVNETKDYYEVLTILSSDKQYEVAANKATDYMFMGHSHDPFQINNGSLFTCVGSSGCRRDDKTFYTVLEIGKKNVKIYKKEVKYDREEFERTIKEKDYPRKEIFADTFFGIDLNN